MARNDQRASISTFQNLSRVPQYFASFTDHFFVHEYSSPSETCRYDPACTDGGRRRPPQYFKSNQTIIVQAKKVPAERSRQSGSAHHLEISQFHDWTIEQPRLFCLIVYTDPGLHRARRNRGRPRRFSCFTFQPQPTVDPIHTLFFPTTSTSRTSRLLVLTCCQRTALSKRRSEVEARLGY